MQITVLLFALDMHKISIKLYVIFVHSYISYITYNRFFSISFSYTSETDYWCEICFFLMHQLTSPFLVVMKEYTHGSDQVVFI